MKKGFNNYNLRQLLRNPMLIHVIQDELAALPGDSLLCMAIKRGAVDDLSKCLKMIVGGYEDNPRMLTEIVGIDLLRKIEEYTDNRFLLPQNTLTDCFDDIPAGLFQGGGIAFID